MSSPAKVAVVIATFLLLSLVTAVAVREGRDRGGGPADPAPVVHEVHMTAMRFEPAVLQVREGDTVVWINDDFLPHTATSAVGAWDSGEILPGASWKLVVGANGAGDYLCTFHPMMTGTVGEAVQDP